MAHPSSKGKRGSNYRRSRRTAPASVNRVLPINFCGGPAEIVAQLKAARAEMGCGVVDLSFQTPGSEGPDALMEALELFGRKVLPQIRDV